MNQLTREQAIAFHDSGAWKSMSDSEIAAFQIEQRCLCVPFGRYHEAVEKTLGRPVFTHEFGSVGAVRLKEEIDGKVSAPSFEEILAMIPGEKLVVLTKELRNK